MELSKTYQIDFGHVSLVSFFGDLKRRDVTAQDHYFKLLSILGSATQDRHLDFFHHAPVQIVEDRTDLELVRQSAIKTPS